MPEPSPHRGLAARARLTAGWLALGAGVDLASLALTLLAFAALLWLDAGPAVRIALLSAVTTGFAEKLFALRVAFDRRIFDGWSRRWEAAEATPADDLAAFDAALAATGLRTAAKTGGRGVDERIRGAMKLLTYQAGLFIIQALALIAAVICRHGS